MEQTAKGFEIHNYKSDDENLLTATVCVQCGDPYVMGDYVYKNEDGYILIEKLPYTCLLCEKEGLFVPYAFFSLEECKQWGTLLRTVATKNLCSCTHEDNILFCYFDLSELKQQAH